MILGGTTVLVCTYAIFLCYAIFDYQDEKPYDEKSPIDVLLKVIKFWLWSLDVKYIPEKKLKTH